MLYSDHVAYHVGVHRAADTQLEAALSREGVFLTSQSKAFLYMVNPYLRRAKNSLQRLRLSNRSALIPIFLSIGIAFLLSARARAPTPKPADYYHTASASTHIGEHYDTNGQDEPLDNVYGGQWELYDTEKLSQRDNGHKSISTPPDMKQNSHSGSDIHSFGSPPSNHVYRQSGHQESGHSAVPEHDKHRAKHPTYDRLVREVAGHLRVHPTHSSLHRRVPHNAKYGYKTVEDRALSLGLADNLKNPPNHLSSHQYFASTENQKDTQNGVTHNTHHDHNKPKHRSNPTSHTPNAPNAHGNKQHSIHKSPHFKINETTFKELPQTELLLEKEFLLFKPLNYRRTDVRVIALKHVCYCTRRNKFLVPRFSKDKKTKFPGYLYRYGAALSVSWNRRKSILASPDQKVVHFSGTTILWRGRSIHTYNQHLHRSLIPIRSLLDVLRKTNYSIDVKVAAESFTPPTEQETVVRKAHEYFLGDVPEQNRIELGRIRPRLLCFENALSFGAEYEGHAASVESYDNIKGLIEKHERSTSKMELTRKCKDASGSKKTIWIMERQHVHGHEGTMSNAPAVKEAVEHELKKAGLASAVDIQFIQAPSIPCPHGTSRAGCYGSICDKRNGKWNNAESQRCRRHPEILPEVLTYNRMTFLITLSGSANEGVVYMPRGSHILEVAPYGVLGNSLERLAKDAHLSHYRMENRAFRDTETHIFDQFGDIARSAHSCWADLECREFRLRQATHVDVHHLKMLLRKTLGFWKATCGI
ncbi:hypothetical protein BWQ96_09462 [Gracilariopsis chorda]|uniref:Uncharacterized protein n=1 Tax=Gracilariopsis chorda TaxID=448386 RepID=A0A2V3IFF1_9FLOR|nr:hypothetical protein BWQ96_09462 [Gracilariopsis chorda]|eukprot:PXF40804.1 hypothetical protein BWQ96_09462 [Gracilariopsis chorda]